MGTGLKTLRSSVCRLLHRGPEILEEPGQCCTGDQQDKDKDQYEHRDASGNLAGKENHKCIANYSTYGTAVMLSFGVQVGIPHRVGIVCPRAVASENINGSADQENKDNGLYDFRAHVDHVPIH